MTDINVGAITEALNNKVDLPTPSTPQDAVDYVVEKQDPISANGYTWYRKYKSGWVEQGGTLPETSGWANYTVTLPVPMSNNCYFTVPEGVWPSSDTLGNLVLNKTATQIQFHYYSKAVGGYTTWEAKGMSA